MINKKIITKIGIILLLIVLLCAGVASAATQAYVDVNCNVNGAHIVIYGENNTVLTEGDVSGGVASFKIDLPAKITTIVASAPGYGYQTTVVNDTLEAGCLKTYVVNLVNGVSVSVSISGASSLTVGDTTVFTAKNSDGSDAKFAWTSSNTSVASVDENGNVKALKAGTVTITVTNTFTGNNASKTITVAEKKTPTPSYSETLNLREGWNFISIPLRLDSSMDTAAEFFKEVDMGGHGVFSYDSKNKSWTQLSADTILEPLEAYWVYSTTDFEGIWPIAFETDTLSIGPTKDIYKGWNAVGLNIDVTGDTCYMSAKSTFAGLEWNRYFENYTTGSWKVIVNGGSTANSEENYIYAGAGGWLYANADGILIGNAGSGTSHKEEVTVLAATSLTRAMNEIVSNFETYNKYTDVNVSYGGSNSLVTQIKEGAVDADVFFSGDTKNMKNLIDSGFASDSTIFLNNRLVCVVTEGNPLGITSLDDIVDVNVGIASGIDGIPFASYGLDVAEKYEADGHAGYKDLYLSNIRSKYETVAEARAAVITGDCNLAIIYKTDYAGFEDKLDVIEIPDKYNTITKLPYTILPSAMNDKATNSFVKYMTSSEGKSIFEKWGFTIADEDNIDIPTYVVGIDVYEPYSWTDENGNIVGFDVDCMKWIAEEEGYNVTFAYIDWDALATYLQTGKRDIICSGLSITPEREKVIDFTDPYWTVSIDVVSLAGKNYTMDQFYNGDLKIGVENESTACKGLKDYLGDELYEMMKKEGKIVDTYSTFSLSMQDLKNGRVDVVIFDSVGIDNQIKNNQGIFEKVGTINDTEEKFAAAVKKGNTELLELLNDGYAKLKASSYWQELLTKYGLTNETSTEPGVHIPGWEKLTIEAGTTDVTLSSPLYNPEENKDKYNMTFELRLADTGEVLYQSKLVKPGDQIKQITLSRPLDAGTYNAVLHVQPYKADTGVATNNADLEFTLIAVESPSTEPGVHIPGWEKLTIEAGTTEVNVDFYNPEDNDGYYYLTFELKLVDTDETLYKSGLVTAGNHIRNITLSRALEPGTYNAYIHVQPYRVTTLEPVNSAGVYFKLIAEDTTPRHTHTYSTEWTYDRNYHWHDSTCGHSVISEYGAHEWGIIDDGYGNSIIGCVTCKYVGMTPEEKFIMSVPELTYNGNDQTPDITVTFNGWELEYGEDKDYTVKFTKTDAGTTDTRNIHNAGTYLITVIGYGDFEGITGFTQQYIVKPYPISDITIPDSNVPIYNGTE